MLSSCALSCVTSKRNGSSRPVTLVPEGLAIFQHVLDSLLCFRHPAEGEECFALEVEQMLFGDDRLTRSAAFAEDKGELLADGGVVFLDETGLLHAPCSEFHGGVSCVAGDLDVLLRYAGGVGWRER